MNETIEKNGPLTEETPLPEPEKNKTAEDPSARRRINSM
jgi:hypothetical protein